MIDQEEMYRAYHPKVLRYVRARVSPADAEDVAANVFVKAFAGLERYDARRGSLSTWIYVITRNAVIDYWKAGQNAPLSLEGHEEHLTQEQAAGMDGMLEALADAMDALTPLQRDVVMLHYYFGLRHAEIAEKMRLSPANVRKICSLALADLRKNLA
ncbi:MAG: RNA polymerase sigma factor [Candidatus Ventricola sp.]